MGKIGKCCCVEGECCLCDPAWDFESWSVSLLGKTFSGTFIPAEKPDPFTPENGCQSRIAGHCIVDPPEVILDCIEESDWSAPSFVSMSGSPPGFFSTPPCYLACPQCFCNDATNTSQQYDEACLKEGLINWQFSNKGVTHSRAWQQQAYYGVGQMLCCDEPSNSVRFIFDFYYHVSRFAAVSSQAFRRFRSVTYDCIYPSGQTVVDPTSTAVYGSWIQPVSISSKPPCLPCEWTQSDFFGNCPTLESNCSPCPETGCTDEVVTYTMEWIYITCQFIGFIDTDDNGICPIPDEDDDDNRYIYYGETTMNAYVGSNTNYCSEALDSFGENCIISPMSAVIEHRFISDCIPCDELTCNVTLDRVTGSSLGSPLEECRFDEDEDCSCGPIPPLCKTIPASITMVLNPCPSDPEGAFVPFPPTYVRLQTFAPILRTIAATGNTSLTISTFAPTIFLHAIATPTAGTLTLAVYEADVIVPQTITPTTASLTLTTFEALLATPIVATPATLTNLLSSFVPTIVTPQTLVPTTLGLVISTFNPLAQTPIVVTPPPLQLVIDTETTCELILTTYPPEVLTDPCVPTVSIVKSVTPNPITLGGVASWTITITNTSNCEVPAGIEVSDQLPDETDILYVTGSLYGGSSNDASAAPVLNWTLPAIAAGDSVVLGYDTDTLDTGTFTNLATIDAGTGIGQSDSESLTVN
jgi:uncharacterized repeat protein (TIGR01451 family)